MTKNHIYQSYTISITATDRIHRIGRLLRHQAASFFKSRKIDLTPEQWRLLLKLAEKNGQTQTSLADPALNDHPNITRILDGLCKRNLVERTENPGDRRSALIRLTEEGKRMIDTVLPEIWEEKEKYFEGLTRKDVETLTGILSIIENNILKSP